MSVLHRGDPSRRLASALPAALRAFRLLFVALASLEGKVGIPHTATYGAQATWLIGLTSQQPLTVTTQAEPGRLVIDVAHRGTVEEEGF